MHGPADVRGLAFGFKGELDDVVGFKRRKHVQFHRELGRRCCIGDLDASLADLSVAVPLIDGALEFHESVADDVKVGKRTSFPRSVKLKGGETVVFAWIVFKSRAHRDRVNAKVMKDKRFVKMMETEAMPFDGKRMIYGGFKVLIDA